MQAAAAPDDDAFARRLEVARGSDAALGLLSHIFSTRTLGLTGRLPRSAVSGAEHVSVGPLR